MENEEKRKSRSPKTKIIVCGLLITVLAIFLILFLFLINKKEKAPTDQKGKDEEEIYEGIETSKSSSYQQDAFVHFYDEENSVFLKDSYQLEELGLDEDYSSCSGTLSFQGERFKKWNFQTACKNEKNNMDSSFLSTADPRTELIDYIKTSNGYLVLTWSLSTADMGIAYFDKNYNLLWERHFMDDISAENSDILPIDLIESGDSLYALGYASNIVGGDFKEYLEFGNSFSFLLKFDLNGNLLSIINLDNLANGKIARVNQIYKAEGDKLYMKTSEQALVLTNDTQLEIVDFSGRDIELEKVVDSSYLAIRETDMIIEDQTKNVDEAQLLNADGSVRWTISASELSNCSESECSIKQFTDIGNLFAIVIENRVYIVDANGKVVKTYDYGDIFSTGTKTGMKRAEVIPQNNSYTIVTYPSARSIQIEQYDLNHKKIFDKKYAASQILWFSGKSEKTTWTVEGEKVTMKFIVPHPISTGVLITLS